MSSQYERELRQVIAGVPAGVEAVIKSCTEQQKEKMRLAIKRPFLVVRAAGSGMEGTGDLLALRGDLCFPIGVKFCASSTMNMMLDKLLPRMKAKGVITNFPLSSSAVMVFRLFVDDI